MDGITTHTRILLVDDHALFREGLAMIIGSQPDLEVVGEASDGLEAVVKTVELKPDLVLMDIQMPGCDGLEAARQITTKFPSTIIIMLTVRSDDEKLFEAIKNGAQGYLLKNMNSQALVGMLRRAMTGDLAITPSLAGRMLQEFRRLSKMEEGPAVGEAPAEGEAPAAMEAPNEGKGLTKSGMASGTADHLLEELSPRELEILGQVAQGMTDKEIAGALSISVHTVKTHLRNILGKLQVSGRKEAAQIAKSAR